MKKLMSCILALVMCLSMAACRAEQAPTTTAATTSTTLFFEGGHTFVAKVLEIYSGSYLVRPVTGSAELKSADRITIPKQEGVEVQLGAYIQITYDGTLMETYPAQIANAKIELYTEQIVDLPALKAVPAYSQEQLTAELAGLTKDQVRACWGEPAGMFSGFYGDIWYTDETKTVQVYVYYDFKTKIVQNADYASVRTEPYYFSYKYLGEGCGGDFIITLCSDGTFQYYEGALSSYIGIGMWTIDENNLTCLKDNEMHSIDGTPYVRTNYFYSVGNQLEWIAEGSDGFLYVDVEDGAVFFSTTALENS